MLTIGIIVGGICFLGVILAIVVMENNKKEVIQVPIERIVYQDRVVYKEIPIEKIVYKEKIVYVDKPVKQLTMEFVEKPLTKVSEKKLEILKEIELLKGKKNKSKKDSENLYTLEMVVKNMK